MMEIYQEENAKDFIYTVKMNGAQLFSVQNSEPLDYKKLVAPTKPGYFSILLITFNYFAFWQVLKNLE